MGIHKVAVNRAMPCSEVSDLENLQVCKAIRRDKRDMQKLASEAEATQTCPYAFGKGAISNLVFLQC